jgi:hypothetical protein
MISKVLIIFGRLRQLLSARKVVLSLLSLIKLLNLLRKSSKSSQLDCEGLIYDEILDKRNLMAME